jgi:hypothetical protein
MLEDGTINSLIDQLLLYSQAVKFNLNDIYFLTNLLKSLKYMVRDSNKFRLYLYETGAIDACFTFVTEYIKKIDPDEAFQLKFLVSYFLGFLGTIVTNLEKVTTHFKLTFRALSYRWQSLTIYSEMEGTRILV